MFPIPVFPSLCSLPSIPFPLFPSLVPYQKQSVVFVTHTSPLLSKSVHSLPSSSLPTVPFSLSLLTIIFPSLFPIDDHVPTLLSYFRLCSHSLSLFLIMPWHSVLDVLMLLLQDCWKCNFCAVSAWVYGPDNYYLCTKLYSKVPHYSVQECPLEIMSARALLKMGARALLNNECSSPQKDGCSCPLKIMGARPHFSREHFMNLFFWDSFLYSYVFIHLFSKWVFFEWWVLVPFWKMGARAPKIMGARAPKNNGCAPPFFQESIFMNSFLSCSFCNCSLVLHLIALWIMSARALLENGCSSPQKDGCSSPQK